MSPWRFALACAVGTSHLKAALPCQDAATCDVIRDERGGETLIAVASDGAGSAQRAEEGSRLACCMFVDRFATWLNEHDLSELTHDDMAEWVVRFQSAVTSMAEAQGLRPREYACTLVAALIGREVAAYFQVGDGAMVVSPQAQPTAFDCVFWPQKGEYENTTNFLTDPAVLERFDFLLAKGAIDEIALFTDGIQALALHYATRTAHAPFFDGMLGAVRGAHGEGRSERLSKALEDFLRSERVTTRTDDDKTLILASRRPVSVSPPAARVA